MKEKILILKTSPETMDKSVAEYIKYLRVDLGYSYRKIAEHFKGLSNNPKTQEFGRNLVAEAEFVLQEIFDEE